MLELQNLLNDVYERGRYHLAIDYNQLSQLALSEESAEWVRTLLA